jgi:hypothetical protein
MTDVHLHRSCAFLASLRHNTGKRWRKSRRGNDENHRMASILTAIWTRISLVPRRFRLNLNGDGSFRAMMLRTWHWEIEPARYTYKHVSKSQASSGIAVWILYAPKQCVCEAEFRNELRSSPEEHSSSDDASDGGLMSFDSKSDPVQV